MKERLTALVQGVEAWTLGNRLTRVTRRAAEGFFEHDALTFAGSMAYFGVLSLFQLMVLAVVALSHFLGEGEAREFVIAWAVRATPLDAETVGAMIDGTIAARGTITLVGIGFLIWGALGIFSSLANGISLAFAPAPRRGFVKHTLIGLTLMALAGLLALSALAIGIVTGFLQSSANRLAVDLPGRETAVWLIGLVVPIILIFLAFLVIYRVVPNRRVSWSEVLPGAIVATILWTVLRVGFTWFATNVARYDTAFGPLSAGVTLIIFMYFASVIVLIGAEFARARTLDNEEIRAESGA